MFRLTVIPEIGNSAQSQPSYPSVQAATLDGKRLAAVIFGNTEQLQAMSDESLEMYLAQRIAAMMNNESASQAGDPKILQMFSMSELHGLLNFQQPSVRIVVTDSYNRKCFDQKFVKTDFF